MEVITNTQSIKGQNSKKEYILKKSIYIKFYKYKLIYANKIQIKGCLETAQGAFVYKGGIIKLLLVVDIHYPV